MCLAVGSRGLPFQPYDLMDYTPTAHKTSGAWNASDPRTYAYAKTRVITIMHASGSRSCAAASRPVMSRYVVDGNRAMFQKQSLSAQVHESR